MMMMKMIKRNKRRNQEIERKAETMNQNQRDKRLIANNNDVWFYVQ